MMQLWKNIKEYKKIKTNKMKKINIILILMLSILWITNTSAQSIKVTVQNATGANISDGKITVEVLEPFGIYSYYLLDGSGGNVNDKLNTPDNFAIFENLASGRYEVVVNDLEGCAAGWTGSVGCAGRGCITVSLPFEPSPITGEVKPGKTVYIGDPIGQPGNATNFLHLSRMTDLGASTLAELTEKMENQIYIETDKILTGGSSQFEQATQEEISTKSRFIYKFNEEGEMEWLVDQSRKEQKAEKKEALLDEVGFSVSANTTNLAITAVFPNPFESLVNLVVQANKEEMVQIQLLNLSGQLLLEKEFSLVKGANNLQIETSENLPKGSYFLTIRDQEGNRYTETIIH